MGIYNDSKLIVGWELDTPKILEMLDDTPEYRQACEKCGEDEEPAKEEYLSVLVEDSEYWTVTMTSPSYDIDVELRRTFLTLAVCEDETPDTLARLYKDHLEEGLKWAKKLGVNMLRHDEPWVMSAPDVY
jgi:hypothetical protein